MKPRIINVNLLAVSGMILILYLTGCVSARKATSYFDSHKDTAAGYCATRYPVKTDSTATVTTDSTGYKKTVNKLMTYSDSLLNVVSNKNSAIDQVNDMLSFAKSKNEYSEQLIDSLQAKMAGIQKTDTAALRKSIYDQVRSTVNPCHDTTITKTVENTARVAEETARADKYQTTADEYTNGRDDPATVFGWLFRALFRKWWFWLIIVGIIAFLTRRLWAAGIPGLSFLTK